nr:esterase fus5 [Quercus suber]
MLERIRDFPETATPEDSLRILMSQVEHKSTLYAALDHVYGAILADPEIGGVIGYSEGAGVAASLILDEQRKAEANGTPKRLKCAVFFTGWPPFTAEGYPILADETEETLDPPTLHIVGANDPFKNGAMALYNVCNEDTAVFFDTGKGHTIPRHGESLEELAQAVRNMIQMAVDMENP